MLSTVSLENHSLTAGHFDQCAGIELLLRRNELVVLEAAKLLGDKPSGRIERIAGVGHIGPVDSSLRITTVQSIKLQNAAVRTCDIGTKNHGVVLGRVTSISRFDVAAID